MNFGSCSKFGKKSNQSGKVTKINFGNRSNLSKKIRPAWLSKTFQQTLNDYQKKINF